METCDRFLVVVLITILEASLVVGQSEGEQCDVEEWYSSLKNSGLLDRPLTLLQQETRECINELIHSKTAKHSCSELAKFEKILMSEDGDDTGNENNTDQSDKNGKEKRKELGEGSNPSPSTEGRDEIVNTDKINVGSQGLDMEDGTRTEDASEELIAKESQQQVNDAKDQREEAGFQEKEKKVQSELAANHLAGEDGASVFSAESCIKDSFSSGILKPKLKKVASLHFLGDFPSTSSCFVVMNYVCDWICADVDRSHRCCGLRLCLFLSYASRQCPTCSAPEWVRGASTETNPLQPESSTNDRPVSIQATAGYGVTATEGLVERLHAIEVQILRLENKLLQERLAHNGGSSGGMSLLTSQIAKLKDELHRLILENEASEQLMQQNQPEQQQQQQQREQTGDLATVSRDKEEQLATQMIRAQQSQIDILTEMIRSHMATVGQVEERTRRLQEENRLLFESMLAQSMAMNEVVRRLANITEYQQKQTEALVRISSRLGIAEHRQLDAAIGNNDSEKVKEESTALGDSEQEPSANQSQADVNEETDRNKLDDVRGDLTAEAGLNSATETECARKEIGDKQNNDLLVDPEQNGNTAIERMESAGEGHGHEDTTDNGAKEIEVKRATEESEAKDKKVEGSNGARKNKVKNDQGGSMKSRGSDAVGEKKNTKTSKSVKNVSDKKAGPEKGKPTGEKAKKGKKSVKKDKDGTKPPKKLNNAKGGTVPTQAKKVSKGDHYKKQSGKGKTAKEDPIKKKSSKGEDLMDKSSKEDNSKKDVKRKQITNKELSKQDENKKQSSKDKNASEEKSENQPTTDEKAKNEEQKVELSEDDSQGMDPARADAVSEKPKPLYYDPEYKGPKDCYDYYKFGRKRDMPMKIKPIASGMALEVFCDMTSGGWTVIQRRGDGSVDFFRDWEEYKYGFGSPSGEHWLGNENIHFLTNQDNYTLRIEMTDWNRQTAFAEYASFSIDDEAAGYRLHVSGYTGTAGDSLTKHDGHKFSTKDVDNDTVEEEFGGSCARRFTGAWWFYRCFKSNLNGRYYKGGRVPSKLYDGVTWKTWTGSQTSLRKVEMKIRRKVE